MPASSWPRPIARASPRSWMTTRPPAQTSSTFIPPGDTPRYLRHAHRVGDGARGARRVRRAAPATSPRLGSSSSWTAIARPRTRPLRHAGASRCSRRSATPCPSRTTNSAPPGSWRFRRPSGSIPAHAVHDHAARLRRHPRVVRRKRRGAPGQRVHERDTWSRVNAAARADGGAGLVRCGRGRRSPPCRDERGGASRAPSPRRPRDGAAPAWSCSRAGGPCATTAAWRGRGGAATAGARGDAGGGAGAGTGAVSRSRAGRQREPRRTAAGALRSARRRRRRGARGRRAVGGPAARERGRRRHGSAGA